jgi:hypothetical protein
MRRLNWTAVLVAVALLSACSTEDGATGDLDAAVPFDGAFLGKCAPNDYLIIPAADCPATGCLGSSVFALCEGASYSKCICAPPGGDWMLVDGGPLDGAAETRTDAGPRLPPG